MTLPGTALSPTSTRSVIALLGTVALTVFFPFSIRLAQGTADQSQTALPYLPALEGRRETPFHVHRIRQLQRLNPGYVIIGDSMAGTRINERLLGHLTQRPVAPLLHAGSGPVFWYLAMKNWVIASGIKPRAVFVFFRDTNLTDTMFRLEEAVGSSLDWVATDRVEEEVDVIVRSARRHPWSIHETVERAYRPERVRQWLEPDLTRAPVTWITSSRRRQAELLRQVNDRFGPGHLRVMEAADIGVDQGTDFHAAVKRSVLPLLLRDASRAGFALCLVRVQRRPVGGRAPHQSAALQQYIHDLREYVEARGGLLHDDTGDPALTLDMYEDGDHIAPGARDRYTTLFFERLRSLFASPPLR